MPRIPTCPAYKKRRLERERQARADFIRMEVFKAETARMEAKLAQMLTEEASRVHQAGGGITVGVH